MCRAMHPELHASCAMVYWCCVVGHDVQPCCSCSAPGTRATTNASAILLPTTQRVSQKAPPPIQVARASRLAVVQRAQERVRARIGDGEQALPPPSQRPRASAEAVAWMCTLRGAQAEGTTASVEGTMVVCVLLLGVARRPLPSQSSRTAPSLEQPIYALALQSSTAYGQRSVGLLAQKAATQVSCPV